MKILSFKEYCKEYCEQSDFYQELIWVYCFFCKNRYLKRLYDSYMPGTARSEHFGKCSCGYSAIDCFDNPRIKTVLCA